MNDATYTATPFEVHSLGNVGADILGIDLKQSFDDDMERHLREALAKFQILVFRNQAISPADQVRLTVCFGDLEPGIARRPQSHQVSGHPNVLYLSNEPGSETVDYGIAWHSDGLAYARVPHGATMLHCIACPAGVGDTLFANQYGAYAAMSEGLRGIVRGLYWHLPNMAHSEVSPGKGLAQPMVRTHSDTGREFLFCAPTARQIRGMTRHESAGILNVVQEYQVRDEFIYRHVWQPHDVVVWENCTLLHNRADVVDFGTQGLRVMHRSATAGWFEAIECEAAEE